MAQKLWSHVALPEIHGAPAGVLVFNTVYYGVVYSWNVIQSGPSRLYPIGIYSSEHFQLASVPPFQKHCAFIGSIISLFIPHSPIYIPAHTSGRWGYFSPDMELQHKRYLQLIALDLTVFNLFLKEIFRILLYEKVNTESCLNSHTILAWQS